MDPSYSEEAPARGVTGSTLTASCRRPVNLTLLRLVLAIEGHAAFSGLLTNSHTILAKGQVAGEAKHDTRAWLGSFVLPNPQPREGLGRIW